MYFIKYKEGKRLGPLTKEQLERFKKIFTNFWVVIHGKEHYIGDKKNRSSKNIKIQKS